MNGNSRTDTFLNSSEKQEPKKLSLDATSATRPCWGPSSSAAYLKAVEAHISGSVNRTLPLANGRAILATISTSPICTEAQREQIVLERRKRRQRPFGTWSLTQVQCSVRSAINFDRQCFQCSFQLPTCGSQGLDYARKERTVFHLQQKDRYKLPPQNQNQNQKQFYCQECFHKQTRNFF